jgi:hypothetical protein
MAQDRNVRIEIQIEGREAVNEFEKISNRIDSLKQSTNQLKEANRDYSNSMKLLKAELVTLTKGTQEYADKKAEIEKLKMVMRANGEAIRQARLEEAQANIQLEQTRRNLSLNEMTYKQLRLRVKDLATEVEGLVPGTQKYLAKAEELQKVNARYKELRQEIQGYSQQIQQASRQPIITIDAVALIDKATSSLQSLGSEVDATARQVIALRREIQLLTGATGKELDNLTVSVQAISQTFGEDFNEVLQSGNVLSKEFGINFSESFKTIEKSLMNVSAVQRGEILQQMKEYSVQAKTAGLTVDQFAGVLVNASNQGIFSDKGIDVVKEFGLRIREQTTATKDALSNAFGVTFTEKLFKDLNTGAITTAQALETIATKLNTTKLTAQQAQTVIADVFGGPGEDAGLNYIKSLTNVSGGLTAVTKDTKNLNKEQEALLSQNKKLATEQNNLAKEYADFAKGVDTATKEVQIFTYQTVTATITTLRDLTKAMYENRFALLALVVAVVAYNAQLIIAQVRTLAFGAVTTVVNLVRTAWTALNLTMSANPIGFIVSLLSLLTGALITAYNSSETFRATIMGIWNVMTNLGNIMAKIAQDLANFDFTFSRSGKEFAKSFNEGYEGELKRGAESRKKDKEMADKKTAEEEKARAKKEADDKKKQEKEADKQKSAELTQQQIDAAKERAQKLKEAQEKYNEATLQNQRRLEDLRISLIDDSLERERQTILVDASRKKGDIEKQIKELKDLEKVGVKIDANALPNLQKQIELLQVEAQNKIAQVELRQTVRAITIEESQAKRALVEDTTGATENEKIEARKRFNATMLALQTERIDAELKTLDIGNQDEIAKINDLNTQKAELQKKYDEDLLQNNLTAIEDKYALLQEAEEIKFLEQNESLEEVRREIFQENTEALMESEMERSKSIYELQKLAIQEQLALLEEAGRGKSAQALKLQKELLKNEADFNKKTVENEKRTAEMKRKIATESLGVAADFLQLSIDILSQDEEARKRNATAIKVFSVGKILADLGVEIAGYFATPQSTATLGTLGAIQMGIAIARSAISIGNIMSQKFEKGGLLGKPLALAIKHATTNHATTTAKSYGTGGMVRNAGVLQGSSHAQGGLLVFDSQTGRQVGEFEGGEPTMILSKNTYANNKRLVDSLLEASLHRNGAPVKFQTGGMMNAPAPAQASPTLSTVALEEKMDMLIANVAQLASVMQASAEKPLRAFVVYSDIQEISAEEENLIARNSFK